MYVLGTAGHVDHGKSVLVHALTGIDPDRLPEEKRREMTIDLGFAWFKLPDGREVGFVDVPGHERFIKNMIAGVAGIDLALLIIAADEGVMPQTREHLAILDLLNVKRGLVVITKKDLVDEEGLELVALEADELIKGSMLAQAPIVAVSAITGEGLPVLIATISHLLDVTPPRRDIDRPRLPIDRVFTIRGFGTVVTGTLIDGKLQVGQEIEILPLGLKTHIRSLETHQRKLDTAHPGSRVAANLARLATEKPKRGMVITTPGWLKPAQFLDVKLRVVPNLPHDVTHNMSVAFHSGTSEVGAKVRLLDREKLGVGEEGWAQLKLARTVVVTKGDLFIIRSPHGTLGGGEIVDTHPRRHRRFHPAVIQNLEARKEGTPEDILLATLEASGVSELEEALLQCHFDKVESKKALESLAKRKQVVVIGTEDIHQLLFFRGHWEHLVKEVTALVQSYHFQFPLRRGMPKVELKSQLRKMPRHFDDILRKLVGEGVLVEEGTTVSLPSHSVRLSQGQQAKVDAFLKVITQNPYYPPADLSLDTELLNMLLQEGKVIKVGEGVIFSNFACEEMVKQIIEHIKNHGRITVAEVRDIFQTSRKYAVALMEYLDDQKITRRIGNERLLR
jgi:selenocysteine-specific elongation factor